MWRVVLLLGVCGLAAARRSPHADLIEENYRAGGPEGGRYSDNLLEDASLDVVSLLSPYSHFYYHVDLCFFEMRNLLSDLLICEGDHRIIRTNLYP